MEESKSPSKPSENPNRENKFKAEEFEEKVTLLCRFCGGARCPQQDYLTNKKQPNAIEGLHSNWITSDILAMQRPSERLISKHNLYAAWNREKITTILNLQQPGEHPYCGDGIAAHHGFSYIPDKLFNHDIRYFNMSWEDMTATTCEYMMKIMDIFDHTFQRGEKIAVHCHAGRGRTLMAICGWLIFSGKCTAKESIDLAVEKREGVLTKNSQRQFLHEFQNFLKTKRKVFGLIIKLPFDTLVERHQSALLQRKKSKSKNVPYFFYLITDQIQRRLYQEGAPLTPEIVLDAIKGVSWTETDTKTLVQFKRWCNEVRVDLTAIKTYSLQVLLQGLFDYFDQMAFNLIDTHSCQQLQRCYKQGKKLIDILVLPQIINSVGIYVICTFLSFIMFTTQLLSFGLSKQQLQHIINRVVKCLTSKKKYNKSNFSGRFLKPSPTFTKHQLFIKMLIIHGVEEKVTASKFQETERKLRMKNADIFFHKNSLKEEHSKEYFEEHVIHEGVYKKMKK